jgi:hypothetical protein
MSEFNPGDLVEIERRVHLKIRDPNGPGMIDVPSTWHPGIFRCRKGNRYFVEIETRDGIVVRQLRRLRLRSK